jgi:hypothetical protein
MTREELAQRLADICNERLAEPLEIDTWHLFNLFSQPLKEFTDMDSPMKLRSLTRIVGAMEVELEEALNLSEYIGNKKLKQDIILRLLALQMGFSAIKEKQGIR